MAAMQTSICSPSRDSPDAPEPTIHFDECGATGPNLLDSTQRTFAYAGVQITESEASELIERLCKEFNLDKVKNGAPVSFSWRYLNGKDGEETPVIRVLLEAISGRSKVVIYDKIYFAANALVLFVLAPVMRQNLHELLKAGFIHWLTLEIATEFRAKDHATSELLKGFLDYRRGQHYLRGKIFTPAAVSARRVSIELLLNVIRDLGPELSTFFRIHGATPEDKWQLDPSASSLLRVLSAWGQHLPEFHAVCDRSNPLIANSEFLEWVRVRGGVRFEEFKNISPAPFRLARAIELGISKERRGLQIADFVAGACVYAWDSDDEKARLIKAHVTHASAAPWVRQHQNASALLQQQFEQTLLNIRIETALRQA